MEHNNCEGRLSTLEAIMPRIESDLKEDITYIKTNMATKTDLVPFSGIKKKMDLQQYHLMALTAFFVINLVLGAPKTLEIAGMLAPRLLGQ